MQQVSNGSGISFVDSIGGLVKTGTGIATDIANAVKAFDKDKPMQTFVPVPVPVPQQQASGGMNQQTMLLIGAAGLVVLVVLLK